MPGLSPYDASYVALAARDQATLVSYDKQMLRVAGRAGLRVLTP